MSFQINSQHTKKKDLQCAKSMQKSFLLLLHIRGRRRVKESKQLSIFKIILSASDDETKRNNGKMLKSLLSDRKCSGYSIIRDNCLIGVKKMFNQQRETHLKVPIQWANFSRHLRLLMNLEKLFGIKFHKILYLQVMTTWRQDFRPCSKWKLKVLSFK